MTANQGVSCRVFMRTRTYTDTSPRARLEICAGSTQEFRWRKSQDPSHARLKLHQTLRPERLSKPECAHTECVSFGEADQRAKSQHKPTGLSNPDKHKGFSAILNEDNQEVAYFRKSENLPKRFTGSIPELLLASSIKNKPEPLKNLNPISINQSGQSFLKIM